jgi:hypothetical protein
MKWSVKMSYNWDMNALEREYVEWLETECKCNMLEDGCSCLDFDEWFECKREEAAECHEDYCA